jgi:hypothetical protein
MSKYNGWTNRATWVINVHFNPQSKADVYSIKEFVEDKIDRCDDWMKDLLTDERINWDELEEACEDEE